MESVVHLIPKEEYETLFQQQYANVYNYIAYHVRNTDEAEDLTADVFFRAYKYWGSYVPSKGNRGAWVGGIARNMVKTYYKKRASKPITVEFPEFIRSTMDVEGDFLQKETFLEVLCQIDRLPEHQQEILTMKYLLHFTNQEIARTLGMSSTNVGVILHRTIKKLQGKLCGSSHRWVPDVYLNL